MSVASNSISKTNMWFTKPWWRYTFFVMLIYALQACATISNQHKAKVAEAPENISLSGETAAQLEDMGWWRVGFNRHFDEEDTPAWYLDAFIAYRVMYPVINQFDKQISIWRFHRRAAADASGHQFSLIFYSSRKSAQSIYQSINGNALVASLKNENYIDRLSFADINGVAKVEIEATSDKNWPLELQKAWPEFAMGASKTWLQLIEQYAQQSTLDTGQGLDSQVEQFKRISAEIDSLWEQNGAHAFLHHLNALFGYQELYIVERRLTRF